MYFDIILHYSVQEKETKETKRVSYDSYTQPPPPDPMIGKTEMMEMILVQCSGSASQP